MGSVLPTQTNEIFILKFATKIKWGARLRARNELRVSPKSVKILGSTYPMNKVHA